MLEAPHELEDVLLPSASQEDLVRRLREHIRDLKAARRNAHYVGYLEKFLERTVSRRPAGMPGAYFKEFSGMIDTAVTYQYSGRSHVADNRFNKTIYVSSYKGRVCLYTRDCPIFQNSASASLTIDEDLFIAIAESLRKGRGKA